MFSGKDSIEIQVLPLFGEKTKLQNFLTLSLKNSTNFIP